MSDKVAIALIKALGMMSENMQRHVRGDSMAYVDCDFFDLCKGLEGGRDEESNG